MTADPVYKAPADIDLEQKVMLSTQKAARYNLIGSVILLCIVIVLNILLFRAMTSEFPRNTTVYTSNAAAVCSFVPVSERGGVSDAQIRSFAQNALTDLHTLDFMNWRKTLDQVTSRRFTPEARAAATDSLRTSGILPSIISNNFVLRPVVNNVVEIVDQGVVDGVYQWQVAVPMILAYTGSTRQGGVEYRPESRIMTATIQRTEFTADAPEGLLVSALFSTQAVADRRSGSE